jgi:seryl-tRNA(Sec) selenium transferase
LLEPVASLEARARKLAERLAKNHPAPLRFEVVKESAPVGGGSLPGFALETWVVEVSGAGSAERLAARLRRAETPVLARLRDGLLKIDLRTLEDDECAEVERMLDAALR